MVFHKKISLDAHLCNRNTVTNIGLPSFISNRKTVIILLYPIIEGDIEMEKIIGKRIQEIRKSKGMTQEELAEAIEISPHYLSALERGIYNIKLETLVKMLNILECSADEVFCKVVSKSCAVSSNRLSERLEALPKVEQERILAVVDTMINSAKQ